MPNLSKIKIVYDVTNKGHNDSIYCREKGQEVCTLI